MLETPALVACLPLDVADALEDRASAAGIDALTLAVGLLRRDLAGRSPCRRPHSVAEAITMRLAQGTATRLDLATWIAVTVGWPITDSTLRSTLARLHTSGRIARKDGRYVLLGRLDKA